MGGHFLPMGGHFFRYLIFIFSTIKSINLKEKRHDVGIHFDQLRGVL